MAAIEHDLQTDEREKTDRMIDSNRVAIRESRERRKHQRATASRTRERHHRLRRILRAAA